MRATPLLVSAILFATLIPLAPGAAAWTCVSGQDRSARQISIGIETYYNRFVDGSSQTVEQVWQETNDEAGLQTSAGMSCTDRADRLIRSVCIRGCPLQG